MHTLSPTADPSPPDAPHEPRVPAAFNTLVDLHARWIFAAAYRQLRDRSEALLAKLQHFRPIDPGRGALGLIAHLATGLLLVLTGVIIFYIGLFSQKQHTVLACILLSIPLAAITLWRTSRIKGLPLRTRLAIYLQPLLPLILLRHWLLLRYFTR
jgi:hypothetical protein